MSKIKEDDIMGNLGSSEHFLFTVDWFSHNIPLWTEKLKEFANKPDLDFLEIGPYEGRSTVWLLQNILTHPTSKIMCIDLFDDAYDYKRKSDLTLKERFLHNVDLFSQVTAIQSLSNQALINLNSTKERKFDFIYVDGSHVAADVLVDAVLSWSLLREGGLLAFDDYLWEHLPDEVNRPKIAIDAFLRIFSNQLDLIHIGEQVWTRKLSSEH